MNHRISPRKNLQTRVVFEDEFHNDFLYFISQNVSTSGIFIQTDLAFQSGTRIFLKFCLYEGDKPIQVSGEITRFHAQKRGPGRKKPITKGIGIRFLGLSSEDFEKIRKFVEN